MVVRLENTRCHVELSLLVSSSEAASCVRVCVVVCLARPAEVPCSTHIMDGEYSTPTWDRGT